MKKTIALALLVSCVMISSCSYIWTYKLLPSEKYEQPDLKGWIFSTDIKTTIRVGRGEDSLLAKRQRFLFGLKFDLPEKKKVDIFYDITVEGLTIKFLDLDIDKALSVSDSYYYSSPDNKQMSKGVSLIPSIPTFNTTIGRRTLFIPLEVDSALLTFDAVLQEGKYSTYIDENSLLKFEDDTIIVLDNVESIRVPMAVVLYRKTTKEGAIGLVPGH